jgi:hypothetical protein
MNSDYALPSLMRHPAVPGENHKPGQLRWRNA